MKSERIRVHREKVGQAEAEAEAKAGMVTLKVFLVSLGIRVIGERNLER